MLWTTTFLLVAFLLGTVEPDQSQEVYNKDETTFIRGAAPKFRDPSDFTTPSSEPLYVTIDGLLPNQHGFQLVDPQYAAQQPSKLAGSRKEGIRKQEEFLMSVLEPNRAAIDPPKTFSNNIFRPSQPLSSLFENGALKTDPSHDSRFGKPDVFGTGVQEDSAALASSPGDATTHSVFNVHWPREHKGASSQREYINIGGDFVGGTSPKPFRQNEFNRLQPDISSTSNEGRRQSFVFRERGTTPAYQQVADSELASQDFGRFKQPSFSSEKPPFTRINANQNRRPTGVFKSDRNAQSRFSTTTLSPRLPNVESPFTSELSIRGEDKFGSRLQPSVVDHQSPIVPSSSRFELRGQENEDDESKFISQLNQKTASFVSKDSHVNGFEESVPVGFDVNQAAPSAGKATEARLFSQDFHAAAQPTSNKRRKEFEQRPRRPLHNKGSSDEGLPTFSAVPVNQYSRPNINNFQTSNDGEPEEEAANQELEARHQAENAKYSFSSAVMDTVNDNSQVRQEVRDGLKLKGMYSYSDGYFKRTVYYEADENGYRVVKEENEPIGAGPQYDPNGEVQVNYSQAGNNLQYKIKGHQLKKGTRVETAQQFDDYSDQLELPN